MKYRLIMGRNCVREVLKADPERIVEVYTSQKEEKDELLQELLRSKVKIREISRKGLDKMVASESHQSYVAAVKDRGSKSLKEFFKDFRNKSRGIVLMLDSIYDPQNMGAMLRAAECFGVDGVVYSKNRGTDVTPTVSKVSSGASELVELFRVSNLAETVRQFQAEGFWVVAAEALEGSVSLYDFDFPEKTLLIMGSEGEGVQKLLSKNSDFHVMVPMLGKIDSLNVSQATAVMISHFKAK